MTKIEALMTEVEPSLKPKPNLNETRKPKALIQAKLETTTKMSSAKDAASKSEMKQTNAIDEATSHLKPCNKAVRPSKKRGANKLKGKVASEKQATKIDKRQVRQSGDYNGAPKRARFRNAHKVKTKVASKGQAKTIDKRQRTQYGDYNGPPKKARVRNNATTKAKPTKTVEKFDSRNRTQRPSWSSRPMKPRVRQAVVQLPCRDGRCPMNNCTCSYI
jgi:hypothetical protein